MLRPDRLLLHADELRIAKSLPEAAALAAELQDFRANISDSGYVGFGARIQGLLLQPLAIGMRSSLREVAGFRPSRTPSDCIEQLPSNIAPSCTTRMGEVKLPDTGGRTKLDALACAIPPLSLPATIIDDALILGGYGRSRQS